MGLLNNVKKQSWIVFFQALIPAYVIERLFWQERGINVQEVVYIEIIYALTVTVCEIPSGILADRFGRKKMLVLCNGLAVTEFLLLLSAHSFFMFALAVFLSGLGKAFSSGSENALLYDSLLQENRQDDFEKLLGRFISIDLAGTLIAYLSGGVLANFFGYEFNYLLSAVSMLIAFLITPSLKEPPMLTRPEGEIPNIRQHTGEALAVFRRHPLILLYCLTGAVLGSCMIYLDEFWQILLEKVGTPVLFFGAAGTLISLFRIPGSLFAYQFKKKSNYTALLAGIIGISAAGYFAIFFTKDIFFLIPAALLSLTAGVTDPLISGYLHHRIESHMRATVESFSSLGLRVVSVVVGLLFGYVSTKHSIFTGFLVLSIICLGYLLLFFGAAKRGKTS